MTSYIFIVTSSSGDPMNVLVTHNAKTKEDSPLLKNDAWNKLPSLKVNLLNHKFHVMSICPTAFTMECNVANLLPTSIVAETLKNYPVKAGITVVSYTRADKTKKL